MGKQKKLSGVNGNSWVGNILLTGLHDKYESERGLNFWLPSVCTVRAAKGHCTYMDI